MELCHRRHSLRLGSIQALRFELPLIARRMTAPVMSALLVGELGASLTSELPMDEPPMTKLMSKLELLNCEVEVCALLTRAVGFKFLPTNLS